MPVQSGAADGGMRGRQYLIGDLLSFLFQRIVVSCKTEGT